MGPSRFGGGDIVDGTSGAFPSTASSCVVRAGAPNRIRGLRGLRGAGDSEPSLPVGLDTCSEAKAAVG
jgi:hypothetical protein